MLEAMGLPHPKHCFNRYPHLLSGGMRQAGGDCDGLIVRA